MNEFHYLNTSYPNPNKCRNNPQTMPKECTTMHSKLLQDFTGKDLPTLIKEETFYIGWGFSYQERSQTSLLVYNYSQISLAMVLIK